MLHSNIMKKNYGCLKKEHDTLLEIQQRLSLDLDRLHKKETDHDRAIKTKLEQVNRIDMLESKNQKLENLDAHQKSKIIELEEAITIYKQKIFEGDDREKILREEIIQRDTKYGGL